jgi:hypothetical protein
MDSNWAAVPDLADLLVSVASAIRKLARNGIRGNQLGAPLNASIRQSRQQMETASLLQTLRRLSTMHLTKQRMEWRKPRAVDAYCSSIANAANGRRLTGNEKLPAQDVVKLEFRNRNLLPLLLLARFEHVGLCLSVFPCLNGRIKARGSMIGHSEPKERFAS